MSLPSPTSTEAERGSGRGFRIRLVAVLAVLAALAGGLAAAASARGPRPPADPAAAPLVIAYLSQARDEIVESELGGEPRTLYRGSGIRGFARLDGETVLVADGPEGAERLSLHAVGGGAFEEFRLPEEGTIDRLGTVGAVVLFTFTSASADPLPVYDQTLMRIDLAGDHEPAPVLGLDGEPVAAHDWLPIPGTPDVLVSATGGQLLRYSPLVGGPPLPLGQHFPLYSVGIDGAAAVVADSSGPVLLDLSTGEETRIAATAVDGIEPYLGEVAVLPDGRRIAKVVVQRADGSFEPLLVVDDGQQARPLDVGGAPVASFAPTPDGRSVVIVVDSTEPGQEASGPILVIDLDSGEELARLPGVEPEW